MYKIFHAAVTKDLHTTGMTKNTLNFKFLYKHFINQLPILGIKLFNIPPQKEILNFVSVNYAKMNSKYF